MASSELSSPLQDLYRQHELPEASRCIRLMRIKEQIQDSTGKGDLGQLRCSFEVFELGQAPGFVALSYTWGEDEYLHGFLTIDDLDIPIRMNLFDALRHVCHPDSAANVLGEHIVRAADCSHIWVDFLCIHQASVLERNHQVGLMGQIYRQARSVAAYTGNTEHESSDVLELLRISYDYGTAITQCFREDCLSEERELIPLKERQVIIRSQAKHLFATLEHPSKVIRAFCTRAYWTRLWIVQECLLAEVLLIYAGFNALLVPTWNAGGLFCQVSLKSFLLQLYDCDSIYWNQLSNMEILLTERFNGQYRDRGAATRDMVTFFKNWRDRSCDDPRDHVFGLMSLVENPEDWPRVDYSISVEELYVETLMKLLPVAKTHPNVYTTLTVKTMIERLLGVDHAHPAVRTCDEQFGAAIEAKFALLRQPRGHERYLRASKNRSPPSAALAITFLRCYDSMRRSGMNLEVIQACELRGSQIVKNEPRLSRHLQSASDSCSR